MSLFKKNIVVNIRVEHNPSGHLVYKGKNLFPGDVLVFREIKKTIEVNRFSLKPQIVDLHVELDPETHL